MLQWLGTLLNGWLRKSPSPAGSRPQVEALENRQLPSGTAPLLNVALLAPPTTAIPSAPVSDVNTALTKVETQAGSLQAATTPDPFAGLFAGFTGQTGGAPSVGTTLDLSLLGHRAIGLHTSVPESLRLAGGPGLQSGLSLGAGLGSGQGLELLGSIAFGFATGGGVNLQGNFLLQSHARTNLGGHPNLGLKIGLQAGVFNNLSPSVGFQAGVSEVLNLGIAGGLDASHLVDLVFSAARNSWTDVSLADLMNGHYFSSHNSQTPGTYWDTREGPAAAPRTESEVVADAVFSAPVLLDFSWDQAEAEAHLTSAVSDAGSSSLPMPLVEVSEPAAKEEYGTAGGDFDSAGEDDADTAPSSANRPAEALVVDLASLEEALAQFLRQIGNLGRQFGEALAGPGLYLFGLGIVLTAVLFELKRRRAGRSAKGPGPLTFPWSSGLAGLLPAERP